jgi:hypothetical protein
VRGAMAVDLLGTTLMPESLLALLRSKMEAAPEVEAVVEADSEVRSEPNGCYRDFPHAQPLPASGCSG